MAEQRGKTNAPPAPPAGFPGGRGPGGPGGMFAGKAEKAKNTGQTIRRLWQYLKRQKGPLTVVALFVLAGTGFSLAGPFLIGRAVDIIAVPSGVDFRKLSLCMGALLAAYGAGSLATWIQTYMMIGISQTVIRD